jgi:hypothetical protein
MKSRRGLLSGVFYVAAAVWLPSGLVAGYVVLVDPASIPARDPTVFWWGVEAWAIVFGFIGWAVWKLRARSRVRRGVVILVRKIH